MLAETLDADKWNAFLQSKLENPFISQYERKQLTAFIGEKKYLPICELLARGRYVFSIPRKHLVVKNASGKKRTVYSYTDDEMSVLKFLAWLLHRYDGLFSPNLYSFTKKHGVKDAVFFLSGARNLRTMYGYKVDISSYFNSIDPDLLLASLDGMVEPDIYQLFSDLLKDERVLYNGEVILEDKGAIPGNPFSNFFANYYLCEMDAHFWRDRVIYLRYSDDILLFAHTEEALKESVSELHRFLAEKKLCINAEKESWIMPGQPFDFLGFSFSAGRIDISGHSVDKIKGKIRRKAKALRRWYQAKGLAPDAALKAMNRVFNAKFYGKDTAEMSWQYWYFPFISSADRLRTIDEYMQQMQRYIVTGRHYKMNYARCPYARLKACGYRPLVTAYYQFTGDRAGSDGDSQPSVR